MSTKDIDRGHILMMKALDGCLDAGEREEWEGLVATDDALRIEFEQMSETHAHLSDWRTRMVNDLHARELEQSSERVGLVTAALVGGGTRAMVGVMLYLLVVAPDMPLALKAGIVVATLGAAVAFVKIVIDRLRAAPTDRYTEVDR